MGRKCPLDYPISSTCPTQGCVDFKNITLRRINITKPLLSPGVILGNSSNPMDVTFEDVVATDYGLLPFVYGYKSENVNGKAIGTTNPIPAGFVK